MRNYEGFYKGKNVLVAGAGGFIGGHLTAKLIDLGASVLAVDIKPLRMWWQDHRPRLRRASEMDLSEYDYARVMCRGMDLIFNLAADMGGIGFIESHKADCMLSVLTSANLLRAASVNKVERFLYTSSACVYPDYRQSSTDLPALKEEMAYPAMPEDGYGWEKLYGERLCTAFRMDKGVETRIARLHNVFGPHGTWHGGREKAPAAICRKVAEAKLFKKDSIDVWGDGTQTRSFLFVEECVEGLLRIMECRYPDPLNLGSSEVVKINQLIEDVERIACGEPRVFVRNYDRSAPQGVRGRNSDNTLIQSVLGWSPHLPLTYGLRKTYPWVEGEVKSCYTMKDMK